MSATNHVPPERMTAEQRRREIAFLLTNSLVRLRSASTQSKFELGFLPDQSVHSDPVNETNTESR
jgi:hypothetical protein